MPRPPATALPAATVDRRCQADPRCYGVLCFRVEVHDPLGTIVDGKSADTCADHAGDAVQSLSHWAAGRDLSDGHIQVCVIDPSFFVSAGRSGSPLPVSFPFASIPLVS